MEIYALKTTASTGGLDTAGIPEIRTIKRVEIVGVLVPPTEKLLMELGINLKGDALLYTMTRLDITDDILHDGVVYEIKKEIPAPLLYMGTSYTYMLERVPALTTDVPGEHIDEVYQVRCHLMVVIDGDSMAISDEFTSDMTGDMMTLDLADTLIMSEGYIAKLDYTLGLSDELEIDERISMFIPGTG